MLRDKSDDFHNWVGANSKRSIQLTKAIICGAKKPLMHAKQIRDEEIVLLVPAKLAESQSPASFPHSLILSSTLPPWGGFGQAFGFLVGSLAALKALAALKGARLPLQEVLKAAAGPHNGVGCFLGGVFG